MKLSSFMSAEKADSLSPEVKAKLLRGKFCACGILKNCFQLVKKVPDVKLTKSCFGNIQYCGFVLSDATDE